MQILFVQPPESKPKEDPDHTDANRQRADPKWIAWLNTSDELTSMTYGTLLDDAHDHNDADRVAALFNRYAGVAQAAPADASQTTVGAVPDMTRPSVQPAAASGGKISLAEWQHRYTLLTSQGLSPEALIIEEAKLQKMFVDGLVTGAPDGKPTEVPAGFI
jgi:hypothetical protein